MKNKIIMLLSGILLISCSRQTECSRTQIVAYGETMWKGITCQNNNHSQGVKTLFNEKGKFYGLDLREYKKGSRKKLQFVYFFNLKYISVIIEKYKRLKNLYSYTAYHKNGKFYYHVAQNKNDLTMYMVDNSNNALLKNHIIKLKVACHIDSIGNCMVEQYVFAKDKLLKGMFYKIIGHKKDSVLIKIIYSSMRYSKTNPNFTSLTYFDGGFEENRVIPDKKYKAVYVHNSINPVGIIKDKQEFWLPKGRKYLLMFYTEKDTVFQSKKTSLPERFPLDYNLFIIDTRHDNSAIVKQVIKDVELNTSMNYPGRVENRKEIQELMVQSGCFGYDENGKIKQIIDPLKLLKNN